MDIVSADFGGRRLRRRALGWIGLALLVLVAFWFGPGLLRFYTEWLWFKFDVGFPKLFWTILWNKVGLGIALGGLFFVVLMANIELARRMARRTLWYDEERALRQRIAEAMEYFAGRYLYIAAAIFAAVVAWGVGVGAAGQWNKYLLFRNGLPFETADPIFGRDIGFYVFRLPFWKFLQQYAYYTLIAVFVVSAATHYLDKAIRVLRGVPAFAPHVKYHLSVVLGLILVVKALDYRISAYYLLYSARGATFGASYADVHAQLLAFNVLFVVALACAALVFVTIWIRGLWLPLAGIGFLALSSLLLSGVYPALVQRFQVAPNEFEREKQYIAHTIKFTRQGFGLDRIEERQLRQLTILDMDIVSRNVPSIENVRLWDYRPLLDTYQNQQAIWDYYRFHSVDVDRYRIGDQYRQVMLAARELDKYKLLRILRQHTWQNEHVFYTHGCGVVMSPVSDVIGSGLPNYVIENIPPRSTFELEVSRHGIYYGELTDDYVIVRTTEEENDYTLPETNRIAKTRYSGVGGVPIGGPLPRLATAARFSDINIVISTIITKDSRILWGRKIDWRSKHIAPFFSYDQDPYIVVGDDGRLYWIQDGYSTSGMYPYSDPVRNVSYIRNSVKVVTDAYDGTVVYYVSDPHDPIVRTYQKIFPELFRPMDDMPAGLLEHIRYPEALFNTQAARLTIYHMTDPRVFYNRIEKWEIARELPKSVGPGASYRVAQAGGSQGETMQAYYAIMKLPGEDEPEFLLMLPFTPEGRPNMVAWLAARCDGEDYGKVLLYNFPKTEQVWGPIQIEASIDQQPDISGKFSLWSQHGSSVIRGNLLVIPLDNSILYIEPIYLKATQSPFPELKQVVVARGDGRVAMRETLSQALTALLQQPAPKMVALEPTGLAARPAEPLEAEKPPEETAPLPEGRRLAQQANQQFEEALRLQREGDWAGYGEAVQRLQQTLGDLLKATEQ